MWVFEWFHSNLEEWWCLLWVYECECEILELEERFVGDVEEKFEVEILRIWVVVFVLLKFDLENGVFEKHTRVLKTRFLVLLEAHTRLFYDLILGFFQQIHFSHHFRLDLCMPHDCWVL